MIQSGATSAVVEVRAYHNESARRSVHMWAGAVRLYSLTTMPSVWAGFSNAGTAASLAKDLVISSEFPSAVLRAARANGASSRLVRIEFGVLYSVLRQIHLSSAL